MSQLSPHFHLREFLASQTAERMGRPLVASPEVVENLRRLCALVLEPVRVQLGRSIFISSGYRPDWLNAAVGGARNSSHLYGCAADVKVAGMTPLTFCRWIAARDFPFDQCIVEGNSPGWSHISVPRVGASPRREILTAHFSAGRATYTTGLEAA